MKTLLATLPASGGLRSRRRSGPAPVWRGVLLAAWLLFLALPGARAQTPREYQIKGVLLYHLTQFVEWPSGAFDANEAPLVIGILGRDPFGAALDEVVRDEKIGKRSVQVRRFKSAEEAAGCQLLFISASEQDRLKKILPRLQNRPVLTVSDIQGFTGNGGMIDFYTNPEKKVRLKINLDAAKAAGLTMSSKLLRVAEVARTERQP